MTTNNTYALRANHINDRLSEVYKECFNELVEAARTNGIKKIIFSQHNNIDVPYIVFEKEREGYAGTIVSIFSCEKLESISFDNDYSCISLHGSNRNFAYMDKYWGDFFNVEKIGQIYQSVFEIIGGDDIKKNEKEQ